MAVDGESQAAATGRRMSSRIQKLNASRNGNEVRYKEVEEDVIVQQGKPKEKKPKLLPVAAPTSDEESVEIKSEAVGKTGTQVRLLEAEAKEEKSSLVPDEKSATAKVTQAIRLFNTYYLHCIQEEEKRCSKAAAAVNRKKSSASKANNSIDENNKRPSKRPDLKAITKMKETGTILYPEKNIGDIPGVRVGYQFFSRAEMFVIGFHSHWLNGIDYIGGSGRRAGQEEISGLKLPIAVSIVMSGQYEDDLDNSDDVVYTGQGGNNLLGDKRQMEHQKMERGNLALKNCMEQGLPVRVTRGHQCKNSYVKKVYTYDGLYKVVKYWAETGVSGFTVYKFRLKRLDNQPPLTTSQVFFTRGRIPNSVSEIRGLVCEDISGGLENIPIPATNLVDDPPVAPTDVTYIKRLKIAKGVKLPPAGPGCKCRGACTDPRVCSCAKLNGSDFPYVHRDGGRLIEPKAVVFECGPKCGCGPDCVNRTSQRGIRYRLEVYRTAKKGWGVRSWDFIPAGSPVCEYIGVLMKTDDIDASKETNYVFDIDCLQTMEGLDGRQRRLGDVSLPMHLQKDDTDEGPEFCIDAVSTGNVTRYINHSCHPNLFVQCVLSDHHDIKQARIVLFAADNIPPLTELSYDYGYTIDSVVGPDGKVKQLRCFCGETDCRKRLY